MEREAHSGVVYLCCLLNTDGVVQPVFSITEHPELVTCTCPGGNAVSLGDQ